MIALAAAPFMPTAAARAMTQLGQPYLLKIAIDRYIARHDLSGLNLVAAADLKDAARKVAAIVK